MVTLLCLPPSLVLGSCLVVPSCWWVRRESSEKVSRARVVRQVEKEKIPIWGPRRRRVRRPPEEVKNGGRKRRELGTG